MDWNVIKSIYQSNIEQVFESTVYWYFVAFFVFLILCFWIMRKLRRELVPVFKDDEGDVQITPHALEELVRKTCQNMKGIYSPNTKVILKGQSIRLHVRLDIQKDCMVKETRAELKSKLETVLTENLSFSNFGGVDIVIKGFQEKE